MAPMPFEDISQIHGDETRFMNQTENMELFDAFPSERIQKDSEKVVKKQNT